jgi:hypothetical protein
LERADWEDHFGSCSSSEGKETEEFIQPLLEKAFLQLIGTSYNAHGVFFFSF